MNNFIKDFDKIIVELQKKNRVYEVINKTKLKINLQNKSLQQILRDITVDVNKIIVNDPTLEEAYLDIINNDHEK